MTLNRNNDRFKDLANKPTSENNCLLVYLGEDNRLHVLLKLNVSLPQKTIGRALTIVVKQLILLLLQGSIVVKTPEPNYPQLPVPPDSIEQSQ